VTDFAKAVLQWETSSGMYFEVGTRHGGRESPRALGMTPDGVLAAAFTATSPNGHPNALFAATEDPGVACITDGDTGVRWDGSDSVFLTAGGIDAVQAIKRSGIGELRPLVDVLHDQGVDIFLYNTAGFDLVNYERGRVGWQSDELVFEATAGGTGTLRNARISALNIFLSPSNGPGLQVTGAAGQVILAPQSLNQQLRLHGDLDTGTGPGVVLASSELIGTTGTQTIAAVEASIGQGGTAGYTMLFVNATENTVGDGTNPQLLLDIRRNNIPRFGIDRDGVMIGGFMRSTALTGPSFAINYQNHNTWFDCDTDTAGGDITVTVNQGQSGAVAHFAKKGTGGDVVFAAGSGVTLRGNTTLAPENGVAGVYYVSASEAIVFGEV